MGTPSVLRDERIDAVKYWLIVLVITGHVVEIFKGPVCLVIWNWIYIFHMPLFVFISGYFSRKKDTQKFVANIWKLVEPLIIYQVLALILFEDSISLSIALTPWWVLWYLLALICWRLLLQVIPERILSNTKLIVPVAFGVSILAGFLPFDEFLAMQRMLAFMPFFFLGYCMKDRKLFLPDRYKLLCLLFLILTFAVPIFFSQALGSLTHGDPYDYYYDAFKRMFAFGLSVPMSLAFMNICTITPPILSWIARQGQLTMQYYIYHALIIALATTPFLIIISKLGITSLPLIAAIYTVVITIGIGFMLYLPIMRKLTNPSQFWRRQK